MSYLRFLCLLAFLALALPLLGAEPVKLPPKDKFYLVMLAGQSNMAGRGIPTPEDKLPYTRVLMMDKNGEWVPAHAPLHFDKPSAGVGPGDMFAKLMAQDDPTITVGIIPTACGGSSLVHWRPGVYWEQTKSNPYDDAIARTRKALEVGTLKAILWHQGESDCNQRAENYAEWLKALIEDFREKFDAKDVPIIIGQLSQFPGKTWGAKKTLVDTAQRQVATECQPAAFVTSEGLTSNPDFVHFDRDSQIEFGKRYFEAWKKLSAK